MAKRSRPAAGNDTAPRRPGSTHPLITIRLLGGFGIQFDGIDITTEVERRAKAGSLIKILALSSGYRRHREELMELLWPELPGDAAANNLRQILHVIRQSLPPEAGSDALLMREGASIGLAAGDGIHVDADAFEEAARLAAGSSDMESFDAAIALYTGDLLPGDPYDDWAAVRREGLRSTYLGLLAEAAGRAEEAGDYVAAIASAGRSVEVEPADEEAHSRLMRLYALSGRRGDALRQYRLLETALRQELDILPEPATRQLYADIVAYRFPPEAVPEAPERDELARPVPTFLTSFVGRERDITAVSDLLQQHRLVTLTGMGGVGKTRLATVLADEAGGRFGDGVYSVDLSSLDDPRLVWPVIASALGLRDDLDLLEDGVLAGISSRDLLLILDNCEHLTGAVAEAVAALLSSGDRMRILATSREILRVPGEITWPLKPLRLPEVAGHTLADLRDTEAISLFLDRLRLRQPDFLLTSENAPHIAEICRRLDGLPLAIEMAAARAASMSLPGLAARLDNAMRLLGRADRTAPERHETLLAALEWSHALLTGDEQTAFARLAAFPGRWTLEAAETVISDEALPRLSVATILSELVDKSLVVREGNAVDVWYRFLAPVRQYATEHLESSGMADEIRARHAAMLLELAEQALPELRGPNQALWMRRLERERPNMRAALAWALKTDTELALTLAVRLGRFWYLGGYLREGRDALHATLALTPTGDFALRAEALYHAGILADEAGDHHQAAKLLAEALRIFRKFGDPARIASALNSLGVVTRASGNLDRAREILAESLSIRRELGDSNAITSTLGNLALVEWSRGDLDRAEGLLEETLMRARDAGDDWSVAIDTAHLGRIAWERGAHLRARELFVESLEAARQVGDRGAVAEGLEGLAGTLAALGDAAGAACIWGAAEELRETLGLPIHTPELPFYERMVAAGREQLDDASFHAAWVTGRQAPLDQIIEQALKAGRQPSMPERAPIHGLTSRQREIAELIAKDLTNQQIADRLDIAPRTVDTHVSNILNRLGCSSRADVASLFGQ